MNDVNRRRLLVQSGLALGLGLLGTRAKACEFFASTLRITHPWTRATTDDATTAVVCMRFDQVTQDDRLVGIETPVAGGAELAGAVALPRVDFAIPHGRETQLSEAGTYVRLLQLQQPLDVGRAYPLVLRLERGGIVQATLTVDYGRFL
jgi:copper(I)-binding protein